MTALRLLVRVAFVALTLWLLLPALAAYNDVILTWFNFLLDDPLVDPLTLDDVGARHDEVFGPVVAAAPDPLRPANRPDLVCVAAHAAGAKPFLTRPE